MRQVGDIADTGRFKLPLTLL